MVSKKQTTKTPQHDRVTKESGDVVNDRLARLRELFPDAIIEGKVDFDQLRAALGDDVDTRPERYSFTWAGKRDAIRLLQVPSRATLVPCPEESVNFDTTGHVFIEGENLEVLKLLYKSYAGRVKMIYIDPPYNTGGDFVYPDDFADPLDRYLRLTGQKSGNGDMLTTNPETNGRFHSAWLSMMYPRLFVARQLLREDGVIFVSIDDREVHNLRLIMNEVFGEENFIAQIVWEKRYGRSNDAKLFALNTEYVLLYRKADTLQILREPRGESQNAIYSNPDNDPRGPWTSVSFVSQRTLAERPNLSYEITNPKTREKIRHTSNAWKYNKEKYEKLSKENRFYWGADGTQRYPRIKRFLGELKEGIVPVSLWTHEETGTGEVGTREVEQLIGKDLFDHPKPTTLLIRALNIATQPEEQDIVLDFFAGSGTTAHAVMKLNAEDGGSRKWICVQLPEPTGKSTEAQKAGYKTVADITKARIRAAIKKLKDEPNGTDPLKARNTHEDLGLKVFKLAVSNYRPWTGVDAKDPEAYAQQLALYADPLVSGWKPEAVLWEVAIKEGYGLTAKIEKVAGLKHNKVYLVSDPDKGQSFRICLDETLHVDDVKKLALGKNDLFICRDKALDDEKAANLALQCRLKTI